MSDWFTVAEARALPGPNGGVLANATKYPDASIEDARDLAQSAIEDALGVYFTPTAFTETLDGNGRCYLRLKTRRPTSLTAVTVDGVDMIGSAVLYPEDGNVYLPTYWAARHKNVVISGVAGYPACPPRVKHAALLLTKHFLVDSRVDDRATTITSQDGSAQYFVTAGVKDALFSTPEVNALAYVYGVRKGRMVA